MWVDNDKLDTQQLKQIQNEIFKIQVLSDISWIPRKIDYEEKFTNFTADE